jgi:hypothetical protein
MRQRKAEKEIQEAKLLGQALATLRMSRGLTQGQVAERAGPSQVATPAQFPPK